MYEMKAAIRVTPNECLADEDMQIIITRLRCKQNITIHAELSRCDVGSFESYAHFIASNRGTIDLNSDPSVGGRYSGREPMGLFWSMKPTPGKGKGTDMLFIRNVESPIHVRFRIFDSHLTLEDLHNFNGEVLYETTVKRWYKSP